MPREDRLIIGKYGDLRSDEGKRPAGNREGGSGEGRRGHLGRFESRMGGRRTEKTQVQCVHWGRVETRLLERI